MFFAKLLNYLLDMAKTILHFMEILVLNWEYAISMIIGVILSFLIIHYLFSIFSRLIFIGRLKKANNDGYFVYKRCPISALFSKTGHVDIEMEIDKQIYNIYLFPGVRIRKKNIYINDLSHFYVSKPVVQSLFGKGIRMSSDMLINRFEGDMHSTKYKVIVDGKLDNNILVFQPEPLDVYVFRNNTYNIIGSGEFVNKLTVYLGKDLIAYVKRSKGEI